MGVILNPDYLAQQRQLARESLKDTGTLPDNYFWGYLRDRRERNEENFDHYHPYVGKLFKMEREDIVIPCIPYEPCLPYLPPTCVTTCPPVNPYVPGAVPEPGTFGLVALGLVGALIWRKRCALLA